MRPPFAFGVSPPCPAALLDAPQLASLALLELALLVVPRALDVHDDGHGALLDILDEPPPNPVAALLAQLVIDRCQDLSILVAAYRKAIAQPPWGDGQSPPDNDF